MRAEVIVQRNMFAPLDRQVVVHRRPRQICKLVPQTRQPVVAMLNGKFILRRHWKRRLRHGDRLMFLIHPQGGGGGSNPLRVVLMLALFAVAGPLANMMLNTTAAAAAAAGGVTAMVYGGTVAAIQLVGSALINALMPVPKTASLPSPSPTYSLTAQGNTARVEAPIPVQYGRILSYPDFAAQPYWEFAGEEQYLFQLLCLGVGEFSIEEIRIEDTPITAFEEIETEIIPPGGDVTLFPTAVITSLEVSGQEMGSRKTVSWTASGSTVTFTETAHGRVAGQVVQIEATSGTLTAGVYAIASVPTADTFTVTVTGTPTGPGSAYVRPVLGGLDGFVASAAGTKAYRLGVDFIMPQGLYLMGSGGRLEDATLQWHVEARRVDDLGAPVGSWIVLGDQTLTGKSVTPMRESFTFTLATPGRYRVRAWRVDEKFATVDGGHQILWGGLRSYLAEPSDRGPVTLIALKMRATNNLSLQASRKIGVISTRKIPVWDGSAWSAPVATSSIAWALADAARNADYGAGLADSRIDLAALLALDAVWAARGDTFNGRFDSASSWWDAVRRIAAAGRAKPFMQGGVLRVVRDSAQTVPVAMFSMRNITKDSFSVDMLTHDETTADAVTGTYFDATTWAPQRVTGKMPGSSASKPAKVELFGIDNRRQAMREVTYQAAVNKYRRRIVSFGTEMEGFIPAFGDLIGIQHDMAGWGAVAEAVGWDAVSRTLTLSEPVTVTGATVVGLRRADGGLSGPWAVSAGGSAYEVVLLADPDITLEVEGMARERTHVLIGTLSTYSTLAKVISARPRGLYNVMIEAVVDDPSVHTADTGVVAKPIITSSLPRKVTRPVVSGLFAARIPGETARCVIGWRPATGADIYHVEMAEGDDPASPTAKWTRVADTSAATQAQTLLHSLRTMIRVRGVGLTAGPWVAATIGSLITDFWLEDDAPFWLDDAAPFWSN